jgi:hypothetical protein
MPTDVVERFNRINLSDCRLTGISLESAGSARDSVRLSLLLVAGEQANAWQPAEFVFRDCAAIRFHVDTFFKKACSDTIMASAATQASELREDILHERSAFREKYQPLE